MLVKKYSNRRLYDTESSRYITLDELAQKISAGADCRVVDAKTGADLTQLTLTQIILESRRGAQLLPVPLLLSLIRMKDDALAEFFGRYVTWALELYTHAKQNVQTATAISPLTTFAMQANPLARMFFGSSNIGYDAPTAMSGVPAASPAAPPPAPTPAPSTNDVAELRRELEELKNALRQPNAHQNGRSVKAPRKRS